MAKGALQRRPQKMKINLNKLTIRPETPADFPIIEQLVLDAFSKGTEYSNGESEVQLINEIRQGKYYIPELSFVAMYEDEIVGHFMFSNFPISNKHSEEFLFLGPVAVNCKYFNQGVGTKMIPLGIDLARQMGFKGIMVEGNPGFYHRFGFSTSTNFDIDALEKFTPPAPECLMVMELYKGAMKDIKGKVDYSYYDAISTPNELLYK